MKMIKNLVSKINYCHIIWFFFFLILLIFTIPEAVNIGQRIINSFICFGKNMWIYFYFIFVGDSFFIIEHEFMNIDETRTITRPTEIFIIFLTFFVIILFTFLFAIYII